MATWFLEYTSPSGNWERSKHPFSSAGDACEGAAKALRLQASRKMHKGFAVRIVREEKPKPPPEKVVRPRFVTVPEGIVIEL